MLDICLLGCGGSLPVPERGLTALLVSYKGQKILVDCGEGTQVSMKIVKSGFKNIECICFTHVHADHMVGLPGILLTIANAERAEPLTIIGPEGIIDVVNGLRVLCPVLPYDINIVECNNNDNIFKLNELSIQSLRVDHSVPCNGYCFNLSRSRKFEVEKANKNNVPKALWSKLQKESSCVYEGIQYTQDMVLGKEREGLKVTYVTDTRPIKEILEFAKHSDLFICEGMYGDDGSIEKAIANKHMLFSEAANLAKSSEVKEMWLTHFSPSLTNPQEFLDNTKCIFESTVIGEDRMSKNLNFLGE